MEKSSCICWSSHKMLLLVNYAILVQCLFNVCRVDGLSVEKAIGSSENEHLVSSESSFHIPMLTKNKFIPSDQDGEFGMRSNEPAESDVNKELKIELGNESSQGSVKSGDDNVVKTADKYVSIKDQAWGSAFQNQNLQDLNKDSKKTEEFQNSKEESEFLNENLTAQREQLRKSKQESGYLKEESKNPEEKFRNEEQELMNRLKDEPRKVKNEFNEPKNQSGKIKEKLKTPKKKSKNQAAEKAVEKSSKSEISEKERKRSAMLKLVHDPHYGLIKSSFGGKQHLHSLSNLSKRMRKPVSNSKKKSQSKLVQLSSKKTKTQEQSDANNFIKSFLERDRTTINDIEKSVKKERVPELSEEHKNLDSSVEIITERKETKGKEKIGEAELLYDSRMESSSVPPNRIPKSVILWTSWRSGSTFLGDLLANTNNNTFYSYEPLFHFGAEIFDVIENERTQQALKLVEDLLACDLVNHHDFLWSINDLKFPLLSNGKFYYECIVARKCYDEAFFSDVCASSDLHVLKIIRLSLRFAAPILLQPRFRDLKIVYLARDPRPVMRSRHQPTHGRWCGPQFPDCHDPYRVCAALSRDVEFARQLQEQFPDRFYFVRYEDLASSPQKTVELLWARLGLPLTQQFSDYLRHTTTGQKPKKQVNDVTRDSAAHAFEWRRSISWQLVDEVQQACATVIPNFGWRLFESEAELRNSSFPVSLS